MLALLDNILKLNVHVLRKIASWATQSTIGSIKSYIVLLGNIFCCNRLNTLLGLTIPGIFCNPGISGFRDCQFFLIPGLRD